MKADPIQRKRFKAFRALLSNTSAETNGVEIDRTAHTCRFVAIELDGDTPIWAYQGETLADVIKDIEQTDTEDVSRTVIHDLDTGDQFDIELTVRVTRLHDNRNGGWMPAPGVTTPTAIVTISGGVAELATCSPNFEVGIVDYDNLEDLILDPTVGKDIALTAYERKFIQTNDPKVWARLEPKLEPLASADPVDQITSDRAAKDAIAKEIR